jgi:Family of unknown function (DUF5681)
MYQVGYCRPPLHSRFKPGQSGNPKGRPRQSRNLRTIVKQVLSEDMQIREGGRLRRMSAGEALVRTILARAFKGDPKALASLILLARLSGLTDMFTPRGSRARFAGHVGYLLPRLSTALVRVAVFFSQR